MTDIFTRRLRYQLTEVLENEERELEIEARFRQLSSKQVNLLRDALITTSKVSKSFTIDYYSGNDRITQENNKYYIITKSSIPPFPMYITSNDRDIKISVAYESAMRDAKEPKSYKFKRIKDRTSYSQDNFRIDITEVDTDGNKSTEVELEVIDSKQFNVLAFENKIKELYELMSDNSQGILMFLNKSLSGEENNKVNTIYPFLSRARDLLIRDMTKEGLMKNYTISVKADGEQKLMIFYNYEVWLFYPLGNDLDKSLIFLGKYKNTEWNSTILTGEWVIKANHQYDSEYIYLPFDCLYYSDQDMRKNNYLQRLEKINTFYENSISTTVIKKKEIITYKMNNEAFYQASRDALDKEKEVKYKTDGLIFTPIDSAYLTDGQKLQERNKGKRILSNYADVCKYKPRDKLTIDFLVREDGLYTNRGKFTGSERYPFSSESYEFEEKYIDKIVEFAPRFGKENKIVYYPIRIRTDKSQPNKISVAEDNWFLVHDPITEEMITGQDIKLMRRYHNQIKGELMQQISGFVVDIGAGAGGVFDKYIANPKIGKVLSIEPNKEFAKEFERRQDQLKRPNQFKLLLTGGEDSEKIIQAAQDFFPSNLGNNDLNICFHISLSFFWKDKAMLKKLAHTITLLEEFYNERNGKGRVKIVYLTIEGERLNKLLSKDRGSVKLNKIELRRIDQNKIYIDIKDSITVHDQIEYLVFLRDLWQLTGFAPLSQREADNSGKNGYILSKPELIYSKLFVYSIAEKLEMVTDEEVLNPGEGCLPVNEKSANKTIYGLRAKGDDERAEIRPHIYRLAVMSSPNKIYHSVLKLLSSAYNTADVYKRHKIAKDLQEKLRNSTDPEYIAKRLQIGIKIINKDKFYNKDAKKIIVLYECKEGLYEPVIYHDGKDHAIFKPGSIILT